MVNGQWSMVNGHLKGQWSMITSMVNVHCHLHAHLGRQVLCGSGVLLTSMVNGQWSMVNGQWSPQ
jgi:hypothetical protein